MLQSEAIPESLKNMLLVMHTAGILQRDSEESQLWKLTWDRIDAFLPSLRDEVFKPHESGLCLLYSYSYVEQEFSCFMPLLLDNIGKGVFWGCPSTTFVCPFECMFVQTDVVTIISHERLEQFLIILTANIHWALLMT